MATKKIKLQVHRTFSEEFKKARVAEYEKGEFTVSELGRLYSIQHMILYRWIHRYSHYNKKNTILVEMKDSSKQRLKDYEARIAELERALGQKQLRVEFLEKMVDMAEQEYGVDIKKYFSTPPLPTSGSTSQKWATP